MVMEQETPAHLKNWYVIHTYAGYELKVKNNLEKRIASMGMEDKIFRILVPLEEHIEIRDGKRKTVKKKVFPGYALVEMAMTDDSWYVVRNTPGVTGFVGAGTKPTPLTAAEIQAILKQMGLEEAKPKINLDIGESIQVRTGPFEGFLGVVDEINAERGKVRVLVSMFGRETPLELDFTQVQKL